MLTSSSVNVLDLSSNKKDIANDFAEKLNSHKMEVSADDYDNIFTNIVNTNSILEIYRNVYENQFNKIKDLSKTLASENKELNKNIDNSELLVNTNKRKVVYEKREFKGLQRWRLILLITFYSLLVLYLIFGNFISSRLYRNRMFMFVFLPSLRPFYILN